MVKIYTSYYPIELVVGQYLLTPPKLIYNIINIVADSTKFSKKFCFNNFGSSLRYAIFYSFGIDRPLPPLIYVMVGEYLCHILQHIPRAPKSMPQYVSL